MPEQAFAFTELLKLVVALGVTIGLFYALALFMKRLQLGTGKSGSLITVLAALPLGGKEKIWVVDVAGEKLVIGTAPGTVHCLHVLKGDSDVSSTLPQTTESMAASSSFPPKRDSSEGFSSFPRTQESSEALASFPRTRESSVVDIPTSEGLDSRVRGNDATPSAKAFSELLTRFRGWQK